MLRVLIFIAVCACTRTSEKYCGLHPQDLYNCPTSDAAEERPTCTDDSQCTAPKPKCYKPIGFSGGFCVDCLGNADCVGPSSTCDTTSLTCRSCIAHADCTESQACLPDGTCADRSDVIYVAPTGDDSGTCTQAAPCATIDYAVSQATDTRFHVKLSGTLDGPFIIANKNVTLLGAGAKIAGTGIGIKTQHATVHIHGLEFDCGGEGIKAEMESTLFAYDLYIHGCATVGVHGKASVINVTRSRITGCLDGGIYLEGSVSAYSITNNVLYGNGTAAGSRGAALISTATTAARFEHNTIADNIAKPPAAAVNCTGVVTMPFNLFAGNQGGLDPDASASCVIAQSMKQPTREAAGLDTMYRLLAGSPAIDAAAGSTMDEDIDREVRPQGSANDFGADELRQ